MEFRRVLVRAANFDAGHNYGVGADPAILPNSDRFAAHGPPLSLARHVVVCTHHHDVGRPDRAFPDVNSVARLDITTPANGEARGRAQLAALQMQPFGADYTGTVMHREPRAVRAKQPPNNEVQTQLTKGNTKQIAPLQYSIAEVGIAGNCRLKPFAHS